MDTDVLIVGGGPAGMMAGLLFVRAGVKTRVLEKHDDFLRDFRGDTVHPWTIELFHQLGSASDLLARRHDEVRTLHGRIGGQTLALIDFPHLPVRSPFIALMPQWDFLDFVAEQARAFPSFDLRLECEATGILEEAGRIAGVTTASGEAMRAKLVIAADGRRSILRDAAALPLEDLGAPVDVLWFRLPKKRAMANDTVGIFDRGRIAVLLDRGDYWQCAWVIPKGANEEVRARGLDAFRADIARLVPEVADVTDALTDWDDVKLLTVALDRLTRWHRPGLLAIGDAAHAMSPVGGVGINLAIQDAVAAANILARPMAEGRDLDALLARVQARRARPTRRVQGMQRAIQNRIIGRVLSDADTPVRPPWILRMLDRHALLRRIPAAILGRAIQPERIA